MQYVLDMHLSHDERVSLISVMVSARAATSARWASKDAMGSKGVRELRLTARGGAGGEEVGKALAGWGGVQ